MPQPLPWFNNDIDPILPENFDIKPGLYRYDQYQTYDILRFNDSAESFQFALRGKVNYPPNFPHETRLLVERFTPWEYPWAKDWTTQVYYHYSNYTTSANFGQNVLERTNGFVTISLRQFYIGDENVYSHFQSSSYSFFQNPINYANFLLVSEDSFTIQISNTSQITHRLSVTYLEKETGIPRECRKVYQLFDFPSGETTVQFRISKNLFVACSLVVACLNEDIKTQFEASVSPTRAYLYSDLDFLLTYVGDEIDQRIPQRKLLMASVDYEIYEWDYQELSQLWPAHTYGDTRYSGATFTEMSSWMHYASLIYANNNYWQNGEIKQDLGKPVFISAKNPDANAFCTWNDGYQYNSQSEYEIELKKFADAYYQFLPLPNTHSYTTTLPGLIFHNNGFSFNPYAEWLAGTGPASAMGRGLVKYAYGHKIFQLTGILGIQGSYTSNGYKHSQYYIEHAFEHGFKYKKTVLGTFDYTVDNWQNNVAFEYQAHWSPSTVPSPFPATGTIRIVYYDSEDDVPIGSPLPIDVQIAIIDQYLYQQNPEGELTADFMPDSIRVKEIHEALQAGTFAKNPDNPNTPRVANLGYYVERIARVLGISVNPDGSVLGIRQKRVVEPGQTIPAGWNFGQWGLNNGGQEPEGGQQGGNANELRDGIVYEQRSNRAFIDEFNPAGGVTELKQGAYVLCENIPQLMDEFWDDLDKGLGWQDLGASAIPNADGSGKYCTYEGAAKLLTEIAYDVSRISQHTAQTQICVMICQALANELLRSTGQPLAVKSFDVGIGGAAPAAVPYRGLAEDAMSSVEQWASLMQMVAPILAANLKITTDKTGVPIP